MKNITCINFSFTLKDKRCVYREAPPEKKAATIETPPVTVGDAIKARELSDQAFKDIPDSWKITSNERDKLKTWKNKEAVMAYTKGHLAYLKAKDAFGKEDYEKADRFYKEAEDCYKKIQQEAEQHSVKEKEAQDAKNVALDVWNLLPAEWQWKKEVNEVIKWSNEKALRAHLDADEAKKKAEKALKSGEHYQAKKFYEEVSEQYKIVLKEAGSDYDKIQADRAKVWLNNLPTDVRSYIDAEPTNLYTLLATADENYRNKNFSRAKEDYQLAEQAYGKVSQKISAFVSLLAYNDIMRKLPDNINDIVKKSSSDDMKASYGAALSRLNAGDLALSEKRYSIAKEHYDGAQRQAKWLLEQYQKSKGQ